MFIDLRDYSLSVHNSQKHLRAILWFLHCVQKEKARYKLCGHCVPTSMVDRLRRAKLIVSPYFAGCSWVLPWGKYWILTKGNRDTIGSGPLWGFRGHPPEHFYI